MARGNEAKQRIFAKLLEVFPGSFMQDDKILRIPVEEGGEPVEIKVTLTAAKDLLAGGGSLDWSDSTDKKDAGTVASPLTTEPTEEEKQNTDLIEQMVSLVFEEG